MIRIDEISGGHAVCVKAASDGCVRMDIESERPNDDVELFLTGPQARAIAEAIISATRLANEGGGE